MIKYQILCDVTGRELSEDEQIRLETLRTKFQRDNPQLQAPGHFGGEFFGRLEKYWLEYNELMKRETQRVSRTIDNHLKRFFNEPREGRSGPGRATG